MLGVSYILIHNFDNLGMAVFLKNISFHGILLDSLFEEGNSEWSTVSNLLAEGIKQGAVKPLNTTVFGKEDLEGAFRFMAQGKHIGKVLVKVSEIKYDIKLMPKVFILFLKRMDTKRSAHNKYQILLSTCDANSS